jgi:hypothetical protein
MNLNQGGIIYNFVGNVEQLLISTGGGNTITSTTNQTIVNLTGNIDIISGGDNKIGINFGGTGSTLNITGNVSSGRTGSGFPLYGILLSGINTTNLTGNVFINGNSLSANALHRTIELQGTTTLNIFGNVFSNLVQTGGRALSIASTSSIVNIYGNAIGKQGFSTIAGCIIILNSISTTRIDKIVGSDNGTGVAVYNPNNSNVIVKEFEISSIGTIPAVGKILIDNTTFTFKGINESNETVILTDDNNVLSFIPTESNVRNNKIYYDGLKVGTMAVPVASNVRKDVPVDDTVGTAELTAADILNAILTSENPVAERLRNVSTVQTTGDQIAGS